MICTVLLGIAYPLTGDMVSDDRGIVSNQVEAKGITASSIPKWSGTRYMNVDGMLPFETRVLLYIRDTGNHVIYHVTPVYKKKELVCRDVHMEAYSISHKRELKKMFVF